MEKMKVPKLRIVEENAKFRIRDSENHKYGTYHDREEAEFYMKLWEEYYRE